MYPPFPTAVSFKNGLGAHHRPIFSLITEAGDGVAYLPSPCKEYALDYTYLKINSAHTTKNFTRKIDFVTVNETRVLVLWLADRIADGLDLLNQIEDRIGIPRSLCFVLPNDRNAFVLRGSAKWLIAPPMLSFYLLLVRAGKVHKKGKCHRETMDLLFSKNDDPKPDQLIWVGGRPAIEAIIEHGPDEIFGTDMASNWPVCDDIHSRGIYTMGLGNLRKEMPRWYKKINGVYKSTTPTLKGRGLGEISLTSRTVPSKRKTSLDK